MLPKISSDNIDFIENNIEHINNFEIKRQMIDKLCDIEIHSWEYIKYVSDRKNYLTNNELLQIELQIELLDNWISEYHNKNF